MSNKEKIIQFLEENNGKVSYSQIRENFGFQSNYLTELIRKLGYQVTSKKLGKKNEKFLFLKSIPNIGNLPDIVQTMLENRELNLAEAETIASLTKLLNIRKESLPEDIAKKIIKEKMENEFIPEMEERMEEVALFWLKESKDRKISGLNNRIENILSNTTWEVIKKKPYIQNLQEDLNIAKHELRTFLIEINKLDLLIIKIPLHDDMLLNKNISLHIIENKSGSIIDWEKDIEKLMGYGEPLRRAIQFHKDEIRRLHSIRLSSKKKREINTLNKRMREHNTKLGELKIKQNEMVTGIIRERKRRPIIEFYDKLDKLTEEFKHRMVMLENEVAFQKKLN